MSDTSKPDNRGRLRITADVLARMVGIEPGHTIVGATYVPPSLATVAASDTPGQDVPGMVELTIQGPHMPDPVEGQPPPVVNLLVNQRVTRTGQWAHQGGPGWPVTP